MSFKSGAVACLITLLLVNPAFAQNRTTVLGEIDPFADARLLHLLEKTSEPDTVLEARLLTVASPSTSVLPGRAMSATMGDADLWLMLLVGCGLVAFHLRRKQKSLRFRPLTEAVAR